MFEQILFPVDNSRETSHAIGLVADLAQRYQSKVVLVSVLDPAELSETDLPLAKTQIQSLLLQTESALHQAGIQAIKTEYREGKVPFVICDLADEQEIGLIVMGCRGLLGEGEIDSVSNRVINLAPCPVLVVP